MKSLYSETEALDVGPFSDALEVDDVHSDFRNRLSDIFNGNAVGNVTNI